MVRNIITVPADILRRKSELVQDPAAPEIQDLIRDMKETCVAAEGIGLAAPQVGVSKRIIIVNHNADEPYALINPEVIWSSAGTSVLEEACLSIPDVVVPVERPKSVKVRAITEDGSTKEIKAGDLLAKILQHEIDHINGVLITDYQTK